MVRKAIITELTIEITLTIMLLFKRLIEKGCDTSSFFDKVISDLVGICVNEVNLENDVILSNSKYIK
jgi:hypothetical protein